MDKAFSWLKYPILGFSTLRSAHYFLQMQILARSVQLLPFVKHDKVEPLDKAKLDLLRHEVTALITADAQNITEGYYPLIVLKPEPALKHFKRIPQILWDGIRISWRRNKKDIKSFSKTAQEQAADLPEYYVRNFHFQTDGYLSAESADLYEHQVELLFTGTADAMRRLIIKPLIEAMKFESIKTNNAKPSQSRTAVANNTPSISEIRRRPLRILEIAAGTGRGSRFMQATFKKSHITVSDISPPYLMAARKKLEDLNNIDFVRADATRMPFKDGSFDIIFGVFLFHELPKEERLQVLKEARRLLKPGGHFAAVDSIQLGDQPELDEFLKEFPRQFHEPFYMNYIRTPMTSLFSTAGLELSSTGTGFLSRYWVAKKA